MAEGPEAREAEPMCLGVPGRVIEIEADERAAVTPEAPRMTMGRVDFAGIVKRVCLAYVPDVEVGDYVIVHVGFAIGKVDEAEAARVFGYLREIGELGELELPQPGVAEPDGGG